MYKCDICGTEFDKPTVTHEQNTDGENTWTERFESCPCCGEPYFHKEGYEEMGYYWYTFSDGYQCCVRGFSKNELAREEQKHGELLRKEEDK